MNISERILDALQCAVQKRSLSPRIPMDLWTDLYYSWFALPSGWLQALFVSMPRRFEAHLRVRGSNSRP